MFLNNRYSSIFLIHFNIMAIYVKNNEAVDNIYWVDSFENILRELRIARVYNNKKLLWEFANSNFFTADNKIIITADGYVFNGRKD